MQSKVAFNGHSHRGVEEAGEKGVEFEAMPKASDDQAHTTPGTHNNGFSKSGRSCCSVATSMLAVTVAMAVTATATARRKESPTPETQDRRPKRQC